MTLRDVSKGSWSTEMKEETISYSMFTLAVIAAMVTATTTAAILFISQIIPSVSAQQQTIAPLNLLEEEKNKVLVSSAIEEIFNEHNITAVDTYIKKDLMQNNTGFPEGREARKQYFGMLFNAFPDLSVVINKMVAEDDLVSVFLSWNGTHMGEFQGMPATNNPIFMKTAHTFRIEDGMVAEQWEIFDTVDLLAKTGVISFGN
jgi:predicted ester cyclase